ncbi:pituitary tumor-transforming gene 1 protein-interacting protein-like [Seriola dumerili]|uniref:Pituitary tumor-transforming gene 1 protein-interacting protein-like n=1 Tax=Seriola dumerili TaxID=41447 RepID=A0A3B4V3D6_SERDU|nr:pituitary tumor-transforming gene 1 protein-interacting protein-like [Seriola dumerili]
MSMRSMVFSRLMMSGVRRASVVAVAFILLGVSVTTEAQTSTPAPAPTPCAFRSNTSCAECLQNVTCLWCMPTQQCIDYPMRNILPPNSVCPLTDARWGVCWVNFQILIITMSVLAGIIIIALLVCCLCCCKCERTGNKREDAKVERQTRARKARQKAKRTEMQLRHDEIRQKYGLAKDNPYSRMDDH